MPSPSRRSFLTYLGLGSYATLRDTRPSRGGPPPDVLTRRPRGNPPSFFAPIEPSDLDELKAPNGFRVDYIAKWDEDLGSKGPLGAEKFGFNCDFLAYFPINSLSGGPPNSDEGLLWVNHEYPSPLFVSGYNPRAGKKTEQQILKEKHCVGGSILHIRRVNGRWERVPGSEFTRRFTALYPEIALTGPASMLPAATGTLANCSGGRTPWFTALSCEENYQHYNAATATDGYRWSDEPNQRIDERLYGWVVEVDPFKQMPPVKHTAMGRFAHENVAIRHDGPNNKLVCYMGDDANDQYLYKFVSAGAYRDNLTRPQKSALLHTGTLYVADMRECRWKPLDLARSRPLRDVGFVTQAEVMVRCRDAAKAVGATPLDRPEDCEIHPLDKSLYVALTNNASHGNFWGQILRLIEDGGNPEGETFQYEIFLAGGPQSGLACPDNITFDRRGNLWVGCDMPTGLLNKNPFRSFKNNGLFVVPTTGPNAGDAFQFASGPKECEMTGPWFTENEETLFLAIQHPGEESKSDDPKGWTSTWPDGVPGKPARPRPSVVAIQGFKW